MKFGAGDEARTRNFQLGKLNFRSFICNSYKIAETGETDPDYNDVYETVGGSTIAGIFLLWLRRRRWSDATARFGSRSCGTIRQRFTESAHVL